MIFNRRLVILLKSVNPRYISRDNIRTGEADNFHIIAKEGGKWYFYRRLTAELTQIERAALSTQYSNLEMRLDSDSARKQVIKTEVSSMQADFYERLANLPGCRICPVTLEHQGDVYVSVEFDSSVQKEISEIMIDFISADGPYEREAYYLGESKDDDRYLIDLWASLGNREEGLISIKTLWTFEADEDLSEDEKVFRNKGSLAPKYFTDSLVEKLVWKMDRDDVSDSPSLHPVNRDLGIVETYAESGFFSDFYQNVVRECGGPLFLHAESDGSSLEITHIINTAISSEFVLLLKRFWDQGNRKHQNHVITEIGRINPKKDIYTFHNKQMEV